VSAFRVLEHEHHLELRFLVRESSNALSLEACRELGRLVKSHRRWRRPVVVTSGHPRLFCAGGNLSDHLQLKTRTAGLKQAREMEKHLNAFGAWSVPKLAVVTGDVLGGGMEWLARFDFRWSTPACYFGFWQRRIGLSPGWGGGRAWSERIGESRLRGLLLESRALSAEAALGAGLVDRVVSDWKMPVEIESWASRLDSVTATELMSWKPERERALFNRLWLGPEHRATLARWRK